MEVLSGQMDVDHALMIDQSSGLTVLPAAAHPDYATAASELLAGPNLASVLARLSRQFDVIVIDTPPVLPVVDARVLANFADGIVMVMTWQKTPKDLARKAMKVLGRNVEKLLGVVVNKVAPTSLPVADAYQSHRLKTVEHLPRAA